RATDFVIFSLAKLLHAGDMPAAWLKERIHYMYMVPHRLGSKSLAQQLAQQFQLDCLGVYPYPHASLGQLRHKFWVFQRRKSVALSGSLEPVLCSLLGPDLASGRRLHAAQSLPFSGRLDAGAEPHFFGPLVLLNGA